MGTIWQEDLFPSKPSHSKRNAVVLCLVLITCCVGLVVVVESFQGPQINILSLPGWTTGTEYNVVSGMTLPATWGANYLGSGSIITLDPSQHIFARVLYTQIGTVTPDYQVYVMFANSSVYPMTLKSSAAGVFVFEWDGSMANLWKIVVGSTTDKVLSVTPQWPSLMVRQDPIRLSFLFF